jgi:hypothetical protein
MRWTTVVGRVDRLTSSLLQCLICSDGAMRGQKEYRKMVQRQSLTAKSVLWMQSDTVFTGNL